VLSDFSVPAGCRPRRIVDDARGFASARFAAGELAALAARLAAEGPRRLAAVPVARRLAAWSEAIAALLDPESAERQRLVAPLVATARLSPEGLSEGLRLMLGGVAAAPAAALAARLPPAGEPLPSGAVVLAGNVPALAAQPLLPALLVGRPLLLKSSRQEPLFAPALVAALAAREPALGDAFAAVTFAGDDEELVAAALESADRVVAYGGARALGALAAGLGARLVAHGPKASFALVADGVDLVGVARGLARDVALFDQRGCLSVHAVYTDADAGELAEALAWGLALEHLRLPPGPAEPEALAAVQQVRGAADLAGRLQPRLDVAQGTIVFEPGPAFRPSPGLRTVRIHRVARLAEGVEALAPWRGKLQGAAVAGAAAEDLAGALTALGVSRVAAVGRLQEADAAWQNGGLDPLAVLATSGSAA
jgi:acyl-CoA reductase-like NAD-dependent aldehyde dehydrogenase